MKIQSLAIIFIIIIMPISMVLSEYISNKIETENREIAYNNKLLNSTYDAIKAYQLNTVNNAFGDVTNKKIQDIEAAAKTFYNSLSSNFNFLGNKSDVMKEYVPAIVFTMYDGYYTYTPFKNTLTEVSDDSYDESYSVNGETEEGLKPYVYYTCRYIDTIKGNDFSIIYTLDNYITIQGIVNNKYVYDNGYLYSIATNGTDANDGKGIYKTSVDGKEAYNYMGVVFTEDDTDTEELKEYVGGNLYSYAKINGKKYYLDENYYTGRSEGETEVDGIRIKNRAGIFFIDSNGTRNYNQVKGYSTTENTRSENTEFVKYYKAIKKNKSAYEYYKDAYEFSCWVLGKGETTTTKRKDKAGTEQSKYNLGALKASDSKIYQDEDEPPTSDEEKENKKNTTSLLDYGNIDIFGGDSNIENADSNFNQHRKAIIRYVVETNLSTAIASFSSNKQFLMPKISETDWETIENDVCAISFMQGMSLGAKKYNGYSVVANTLTKEYIDENDIYLLTKNSSNQDIYCKVNDKSLGTELTLKQKNNLGYYAGVWKLDFEQRQLIKEVTVSGNKTEENVHYYPHNDYGSYTSIMGSYSRNTIADKDMYKYIASLGNLDVKTAYLKALGRERWGSYNVNNINYELYGNSNGNIYFLEDYNVNL